MSPVQRYECFRQLVQVLIAVAMEDMALLLVRRSLLMLSVALFPARNAHNTRASCVHLPKRQIGFPQICTYLAEVRSFPLRHKSVVNAALIFRGFPHGLRILGNRVCR